MPSSSAIAAACSGPAPPKASSAKRRGSMPRSTVITRSARTISALATRTMPSAHASRVEARARRPARSTARVRRVRRRASTPPASGHVGVEVAEDEVGVGDRRLGAAAPVARRARARRPRCAGPTRSAPPGSRQAIEPPPAPTVWMSTIGSASGRPPTSRAGRLAHARRPRRRTRRTTCRPCRSTAGRARRSARRAAPPRPRRRPGPLSTVSAAWSAAASSVGQPAAGLHDRRARAGRRRARASSRRRR